jgi:hypothetical protein
MIGNPIDQRPATPQLKLKETMMATVAPTPTARATAMITNNPKRAAFWGGDTGTVWAAIDLGVNNTVRNIRVIQTVILGTQLSGVMSVPDDRLNLEKMSIVEGLTKPYIELAVGFSLSNGQVQDPTGSAATRLAKFAAKALALAEDLVFLQGEAARPQLPPTVKIESGQDFLGQGILGLVQGQPIPVHEFDQHQLGNSGEGILAAVMAGIAKLSSTQSGPYYLIEDMNAFIATCGTTINGIPTNQILSPALLGGSISASAAMPANTGLLIATGGDPTTIYVDTDPVTEPTHQDGPGRYFFRTFERVQYVASDPGAFVKLDFSYLEHLKPRKK